MECSPAHPMTAMERCRVCNVGVANFVKSRMLASGYQRKGLTPTSGSARREVNQMTGLALGCLR